MSNRNPASVLGMLQGNKNAAQLEQIANKQWNDFISSASAVNPWVASAVLSGTFLPIVPEIKHQGIVQILSSTTANSGGAIRATQASLLLSGGEKTTSIFKTPAALATTTTRFGFHDCGDSADAVDGVYIEIVGTVLLGKTSNFNTRSVTSNTYTITPNTWYRSKVELNEDATLATYTLYADDSETVLWTNTLATNIPKTAGREVGHGFISTSSGTTAISLANLDYMDIILSKTRKV